MNTDYTDKKNKITQINVRIVSNKKIISNYYKLVLNAPGIARYAQPGQFVNLKVSESYEPLLRRPLSIHRLSRAKVTFLYEVAGKGTEILSQRKEGEFLDVIGPLGKGFDYDGRRMTPACRQAGTTGRRILVAGGMGTAPLVFLAEKIVTSHKSQVTSHRSQVRGKPLVLIGAKTKKDILCEDEFKKLGCEVKIATDDGSRGFKGKVTDLLNKILRLAISNKRLAIYACGPVPMLKEICLISQKYNIPAQISLEAHLACGIGACMGCVIKVKSEKRKTQNASHVSLAGDFEYKRVCYDGPVFAAGEIVW